MKLVAAGIRPNIVTPPYRVSQPAEHGIPVRIIPDDLIPERSGVVSWWSSVKREGEWVVPCEFRAFACMGNIEIDLTYALMGSGVTEMELNCFMATIEVIVPADIQVECDGDEMLGQFEVKRIGVPAPPPGAPTLRISGTAYVSTVTIKVVDPNAPGWTKKLKSRLASLKVKARG